MLDRPALAYIYDGSFDGFMCCVFESYVKRELPIGIQAINENRGLLFETKWIETDLVKAERVYTAIKAKISQEAQKLVDLGFLTCLPEKEMLILRFLRLGFRIGGSVMNIITDDTLHQLQKAIRHLTSELHKYKGFIRFSLCANVLVTVIEPKNYILSLLEPHFCDRFQDESFMIYDKTHKSALIYRPREWKIVDLEDYEMPPSDPQEAEYRQLWKQFYNTIAIEGRYNPKCRMSHMPKRYWNHMTELQDVPGKITVIEKPVEPGLICSSDPLS